MAEQHKIKTVGALALAVVARIEGSARRANQRAVGWPTDEEQELYDQRARERAARPFA